MLEELPSSQWTRRTAVHLLNRTSFGCSPTEVEAIYQLGKSSGIASVVDQLVDTPVDWSGLPIPTIAPLAAGEMVADYHRERRWDFTHWYLSHMSDGPGLQAKMFKFWVDHFPIDIEAIRPSGAWYPFFYRHFDILRGDCVGNFSALLHAISWSGGMMRMLDLQTSSRGNINENFGRELMELFVLGVDAGYNEADVTEVARAFTGREIGGAPDYTPFLDESVIGSGPLAGEYSKIDPTEKTILGTVLPAIKKPADQLDGDPKEHGESVLDILLTRPEAGTFLANKLWRYFVAPNPTEALTVELGNRLRSTYAYQLKPLLKDILKSVEFYDEEVIGNQVKDPVDHLISSAKALETPLPPRATAYYYLKELGQDLFEPPNIAGWPEPERERNGWVSANRMLSRINFAPLWTHGASENLASFIAVPKDGVDSEVPLPSLDITSLLPRTLRSRNRAAEAVTYLARRILPLHKLGEERLQALCRHAERTRFGYSAEEIYREVVQVLVSLPEFQVQ